MLKPPMTFSVSTIKTRRACYIVHPCTQYEACLKRVCWF